MLNVKNLLRAAVLGVLLSTAVPAAASAATGSVSGTATAASTGNPVAGYTVELYDAGRAPAGSTCTDASGAYRFTNLATGTYYVRFSGDPAAGCATAGFAASWFDGRAAGKFATAVAVTDGVATPRINGSLQDEATIGGRATDAESGAAIANVSVRVLDSDLVEAGRACTTADGSYRVLRLNAFPYLVRFVSDGSCGAVAGYPSRAYSTDDPRGVASDAGGSAVAPFYGQDLPGISILLSLMRHTLGVTVTGPGSVTGGGIACPGTCSTQAPAGNSVTLTPVTPAGSTFTGWTGACAAAGVGPCTVKLDADRTAGATFATVGGGGVPGGGDGGAPGGGAPAGGGGG
ncbi:carboxypeptidase regulatory-like domain-containing protein, partial [Patulibacter sp.]|uniref:carboxypeptidase regulatory-like domain-containing protein n=1 Tax=Patulibacter sp. TaxID=1912859 RepID=UPI002723C23B